MAEDCSVLNQSCDQIALSDLVTHGYRQIDNDASNGSWHIHGGLVAFERDDRVFGGDSVALRDEHFDDVDFVELSQVGDPDLETSIQTPRPSRGC